MAFKSASAFGSLYKKTLYDEVLPFWEKNSPDKENGGYFTCLEEKGNVYDTDKFVWLQAREVWMFSRLANSALSKKPISEPIPTVQRWLQTAILGAEFLKKSCRDPATKFYYFSVSKKGKPIMQPYSIFSDCFACMAFAQLSSALKKFISLQEKNTVFQIGKICELKFEKLGPLAEEYAALAKEAFQNINSRKSNPKGQWAKGFPGTRPFSSLAVPMIDTNLCIEVLDAKLGFDENIIKARIEACLKEIFERFYDDNLGFLIENRALREGTMTEADVAENQDTHEGRLLNPGHAMEALWFIMDVYQREGILGKDFQVAITKKNGEKEQLGRDKMLVKITEILMNIMSKSWDEKYGGFFYFMDSKGRPTQQLEFDQKLWWVHLEALVAIAKAYQVTKRKEFVEWYEKVHSYV